PPSRGRSAIAPLTPPLPPPPSWPPPPPPASLPLPLPSGGAAPSPPLPPLPLPPVARLPRHQSLPAVGQVCRRLASAARSPVATAAAA
ncbi:Os08g0211025, partial [Oryza sativa Japonica Group]